MRLRALPVPAPVLSESRAQRVLRQAVIALIVSSVAVTGYQTISHAMRDTPVAHLGELMPEGF